MKNSLIKNILIFVVVFLVIASIFSLYNINDTEITDINTTKLVERINNEEVKTLAVDGNSITLTLSDDTQ